MVASRGTVAVKYTGDNSDLKRANAESQKTISDLGDNAKASFSKVSVGAAAVGVGILAMGKNFVSAAEDSQKVGKQTEAVLKSMGGQANVTADDVGNLADSLSKKSGVDDEVIQSGENVLLTFGKVRNEVGAGNDVFNRATTAALDMSVALGTDLQSATTMVGKALNDPIKGITAMTKAGVSFTEQQKDQIKTMVQSGDTLGAQKLIMKELESEFAGSAEAGATSSAKLSVAFGNLEEDIGGLLLPAFNTLASGAQDVVGAFESLPPPMQSIIVEGAAVVGGLLAIGGTLSFAVDKARGMKDTFGGLVGPLRNAEGGLSGVGTAVGALGLVGAVAGLAAFGQSLGGATIDVDRLATATANLNDENRKNIESTVQALWNAHRLDDAVSDLADSNVVAASRFVDVAESAGINSDAIAALRVIIDEKRGADVQGAVDQKANSDAIRDGAAAAEEQTDSLKALADQLKANMDPLFAVEQAEQALKKAQQDAAVAARDHGAASTEAAAANDAAVQAAYRYQSSLLVLRQAVKDGTVSIDDAKASLRAWAADGSITEEQARQAAAEMDGLGRSVDALDGKRARVTVVYSREDVTGPGSAAYDREHRAGGGPVRKGETYVVGENRPELFVPGENGTILPSVPSTGGGSPWGTGSATVGQSVVVNVDARGAIGVNGPELGRYLVGLINEAKRKGIR